MSTYPTTLVPNLSAIPESVDQSLLHERGLYVAQGLTVDLAEQLVEASRQPHIADLCENDKLSRFNSLSSLTDWLLDGKLTLPLLRDTGSDSPELVGFGWMAAGVREDIPGSKASFAIRLYEAALGQGNALPYTCAILATHNALFGNDGVWLDAWKDNTKAVTTYAKAGFQFLRETTGLRHGEPTPRIYMTLGRFALA